MEKEPQSREGDIAFLLISIRELQIQLESCFNVVESLGQNPEVQQTYAEETLPLTWDYELLTEELHSVLLEHFAWEKITNQPINLSFRRAYKELKLAKE